MDVREKLVELIHRAITIWNKGDVSVAIADHLIANGVTIPVRCGECKHYGWEQEPCHGRTQHFCKLHKGLVVVYRDTFCSYGERRNDVLSDAQLPDGGEL